MDPENDDALDRQFHVIYLKESDPYMHNVELKLILSAYMSQL